MDGREQRGLEMAATLKLRREGRLWVVPSQTGPGSYAVDPKRETCSCPDFEARQAKCKHIYAVEFTLRRETRLFGLTVSDSTLLGIIVLAAG